MVHSYAPANRWHFLSNYFPQMVLFIQLHKPNQFYVSNKKMNAKIL